jgi:hypothetical protein
MTATHPLVDSLVDANAMLRSGKFTRKVVHRDDNRQVVAIDEMTLGPTDAIRDGLVLIGDIEAALPTMQPDEQTAAQVATIAFCELAEPHYDADGWAKLDKMARAVAANLADRGVRVRPPYTPAKRAKGRA